jgi:hypothetical protein
VISGAHAAFLRYALVYFIVQFRTRLAECFWVGDQHVNRFVNKLGRVTLLITNLTTSIVWWGCSNASVE